MKHAFLSISWLAVVILLTLTACSEKKSALLNAAEEARESALKAEKVSYAEFVEANPVGSTTLQVITMLGEPDQIYTSGDIETWSYGPDVDLAINGKAGSIVGVSVVIDGASKVINISPHTKSPF